MDIQGKMRWLPSEGIVFSEEALAKNIIRLGAIRNQIDLTYGRAVPKLTEEHHRYFCACLIQAYQLFGLEKLVDTNKFIISHDLSAILQDTDFDIILEDVLDKTITAVRKKRKLDYKKICSIFQNDLQDRLVAYASKQRSDKNERY